jgi:transcriptional regulator with GAF, ATPase, and Fis domain
MKRRIPLGVIRTPTGEVVIKDRRIAATLEAQQTQLSECARALEQTRQHWQQAAKELTETRAQLGRLQNRWWTRLGEALGMVKP